MSTSALQASGNSCEKPTLRMSREVKNRRELPWITRECCARDPSGGFENTFLPLDRSISPSARSLPPPLTHRPTRSWRTLSLTSCSLDEGVGEEEHLGRHLALVLIMRCLPNCWGRDQGNHKTVDGQGLHEGQGQQPVEHRPSRALCPIRQFLARPM